MNRGDDDPLVIPTRVAHAGHDEHTFLGHRVYEELAGRVSLSGLMAIAINGSKPDETDQRVLDDLAAVCTLADPRIWPPKVTRLGSAYGGTLEGIAAGLLCMDCRFVGFWQSSQVAAELLLELHAAADGEEQQIDEAAVGLVKPKGFIPGFGVPYREHDERFPPLQRCLKERGRDGGHFVALFDVLTGVVKREKGLAPNVSGLLAAVCLDLNFAPDEIGPLMVCLAIHQFVANAHEGARQAPAALRKLPDDRIRYTGPAPRRSPRKAEAEEP